MTDLYAGQSPTLGDTFVGGEAVTPSDTVPLAIMTRGLWVGDAGNVAVTMRDGSSVTFLSVAAGTLLRIAASAVKVTGTTATNIVGLY